MNVVAVRYGLLADGQSAQFTGTATRIQTSHAFRVRLMRGGEVLDDVWTLRAVWPLTKSHGKEVRLFSAGVLSGDVPFTGILLGIARESAKDAFDMNFSYVDPTNPKKSGIDLSAYPAFGTKIKLATFDATVIS